jgi:hypothetical protein
MFVDAFMLVDSPFTRKEGRHVRWKILLPSSTSCNSCTFELPSANSMQTICLTLLPFFWMSETTIVCSLLHSIGLCTSIFSSKSGLLLLLFYCLNGVYGTHGRSDVPCDILSKLLNSVQIKLSYLSWNEFNIQFKTLYLSRIF